MPHLVFPAIEHRHPRLVALLLVVVGVGSDRTSHAQTATRPNIIMIAVDDLNDWVGPLGGASDVLSDPVLRSRVSPNLDRLAQRGVTFTNAQTAHPACNPSRAALLSGVSGATSGLTTNAGAVNWRTYETNRWLTSLPEYLRVAGGYRIETDGKVWHADGQNDLPTTSPTYDGQRAFTLWDATPNAGNGSLPSGWTTRIESTPWDLGNEIKWNKQIPRFNNQDVLTPAASELVADTQNDVRIANWAGSIVASDQSGGQPKFVAAGIFRPHLPWNVPVDFFNRFPINSISIPQIVANPTDPLDNLDTNDLSGQSATHGIKSDHPLILAATPGSDLAWRSAIQAYLASIAYADYAIGKILDDVEAKNSDADPNNNWTVVLWSDHGWHLGEKENWRKFTVFEESARSNFMVWAPGVTDDSAGQRIETPVDFLDLFPTVADLSNLPGPPQLQGKSLRDLLVDPNSRETGLGVTVTNDDEVALRFDRYRYIRMGDGSEQLYDHELDPREFTNLANSVNNAALPSFNLTTATRNELLAQHRGALLRWLVRAHALMADNGSVVIENLVVDGQRHIDRFSVTGALTTTGWTLRDGGGPADDLDFSIANGKATAPAGVRALTTRNGVSLSARHDFFLAINVALAGDSAGVGLLFGYEDNANFYEFQVVNQDSTSSGSVGLDLRLLRHHDGVEEVLLQVTNLAQLDPSKAAPLDFSTGDYRLIVEYSYLNQELSLLLQNGLGINQHRSTYSLNEALALGSQFGLSSWAARAGNTLDDFIAYSFPGERVPGDFNGDRQIDAADFTLWRDQQGTLVVPGSSADANGNGVVDPDDLQVWRTNFGQLGVAESRTAARAVPECSTAALLVLNILVVLGVRSTRSARGTFGFSPFRPDVQFTPRMNAEAESLKMSGQLQPCSKVRSAWRPALSRGMIRLWLAIQGLILSNASQAAESVAQLTSSYSGSVDWDATEGTLTFVTSGAINFPAKAASHYDSWWEVPAQVKKIVIGANVTVSGHFAFEQNGAIEGRDRNTSVIFGTNEANWANNRNLTAFEYPAIQARDNFITIDNLTLRNPKSFHIRGDATSRIKLSNANLIDTRGGGGNHSDGIVGGTGTLVDNVLFSTGDDAIKVYWGGTMYRDVTVQMIQNAVPIQLGWNDSSVNSISYFQNLRITGTSGRGGAQRYPIISGAGGSYTRRIHIEGADFQNPNASIFELADVGQIAQGGIDQAVINSVRYKAATSNGTISMPINGSVAQQPDFNNPAFDDPNVLPFPADTEHTIWTGGGGANRSLDNNANWNLTKPTIHFPGRLTGATTAHIGSSGGAQGNVLDGKLLKVSGQAMLLVNNTTLGTSALTWDNGEVSLSEQGTWRSDLTGAFNIGFDSGGPATINVADQALLDVAGALVIGRNSRGAIHQTGGLVIVGALSLDAGTATSNRYNLSGGAASAATLSFGDDSASWFNFMGGSLGSLTIRQTGFNFASLIASGRIRLDNAIVPLAEFQIDNTVIGQTTLTLAGPPGDFNRDGAVDAADYVTWRDGLGTTYTVSDYEMWRTNFDTTSPSTASTAVSEPLTIFLALLAFGCSSPNVYLNHRIVRTCSRA